MLIKYFCLLSCT